MLHSWNCAADGFWKKRAKSAAKLVISLLLGLWSLILDPYHRASSQFCNIVFFLLYCSFFNGVGELVCILISKYSYSSILKVQYLFETSTEKHICLYHPKFDHHSKEEPSFYLLWYTQNSFVERVLDQKTTFGPYTSSYVFASKVTLTSLTPK